MTTGNISDQNSAQDRNCCGQRRRSRGLFWGTALILLGGATLLNNFVPFENFGRYVFPLFLLAWGVYILSGVRWRQQG
jgi:hypothetical protein